MSWFLLSIIGAITVTPAVISLHRQAPQQPLPLPSTRRSSPAPWNSNASLLIVHPRTITMAGGRAPCLVELSGVQLTPEIWQRTLLVGGTKPASAYIATAERWLRDGNVIYLSGIGHAAATVVRIAEILRLSSMALVDRVATGTTLPHQEGFESRKAVMWIAMRRSHLFEKAVAEAAEAKALGLAGTGEENEDDDDG